MVEKFYFQRLKIWQKSHLLTLEIYKISQKFPKSEKYGITSQIRRSASSVPANIVEGYSRKGSREFLHFLYQARASLDETTYFLILSKDLKYLSKDESDVIFEKIIVVMKMLNKFISYQKSKL